MWKTCQKHWIPCPYLELSNEVEKSGQPGPDQLATNDTDYPYCLENSGSQCQHSTTGTLQVIHTVWRRRKLKGESGNSQPGHSDGCGLKDKPGVAEETRQEDRSLP